jgi:hypothetical protein
MAVDFTKMKKRDDLGWGVFEAEDSTIWKRAGVDGNYTYYGGSTESELEKLSKRREKYKQAEIKRKAKNEPFHNWIKGLFGLESSNVKDKNMANEGFFRELEGNRWPEKGSILDSMGADIASWLIGQDPETGEIPEQKAHDSINDIIAETDWETEGFLNPMDLVMGIGGLGMSGSKGIQNILSKIKARNARGLRNLRQGQGTGQQSMSPSDRAFLNKEHGEFKKLKELVEEYDYVGLANPERADDIVSIFKKRFGNKNASKVMDIIYKKIFGE